jgi:hypothetical protein
MDTYERGRNGENTAPDAASSTAVLAVPGTAWMGRAQQSRLGPSCHTPRPQLAATRQEQGHSTHASNSANSALSTEHDIASAVGPNDNCGGLHTGCGLEERSGRPYVRCVHGFSRRVGHLQIYACVLILILRVYMFF